MIPVNEPLLGERELEYVSECVRTGWISSAGRFLSDFENGWAARCGRRYGVAVSSGTAALQVAVDCLDLEPDDEVIMPAFTIISCALAVLYCGGRPVLVDSEPRTRCMDVSAIEDKLTPRTRAIMPVHIYGHPVDMDPILDAAERHGLSVVEDAAEAHGARYLRRRDTAAARWESCGAMGALSCFSFYANKLITTGEGGMVLTDDASLARRAAAARNLCFGRDRRFVHDDLGFNFRLTNLQAGLGLAQLERFEEIVDRKRWLGRQYARRLSEVPGLELPVEEPWARSVYWMYAVVVREDTGMDAEALAEQLRQQGIETRPFFTGLHEQPALRREGLFAGESFPVTERLGRQGLYLPSGLGISEKELDRVCQAVEEVLA